MAVVETNGGVNGRRNFISGSCGRDDGDIAAAAAVVAEMAWSWLVVAELYRWWSVMRGGEGWWAGLASDDQLRGLVQVGGGRQLWSVSMQSWRLYCTFAWQLDYSRRIGGVGEREDRKARRRWKCSPPRRTPRRRDWRRPAQEGRFLTASSLRGSRSQLCLAFTTCTTHAEAVPRRLFHTCCALHPAADLMIQRQQANRQRFLCCWHVAAEARDYFWLPAHRVTHEVTPN